VIHINEVHLIKKQITDSHTTTEESNFHKKVLPALETQTANW